TDVLSVFFLRINTIYTITPITIGFREHDDQVIQPVKIEVHLFRNIGSKDIGTMVRNKTYGIIRHHFYGINQVVRLVFIRILSITCLVATEEYGGQYKTYNGHVLFHHLHFLSGYSPAK